MKSSPKSKPIKISRNPFKLQIKSSRATPIMKVLFNLS